MQGVKEIAAGGGVGGFGKVFDTGQPWLEGFGEMRAVGFGGGFSEGFGGSGEIPDRGDAGRGEEGLGEVAGHEGHEAGVEEEPGGLELFVALGGEGFDLGLLPGGEDSRWRPIRVGYDR